MGKIITWKEAFAATKTLRDIREENNLEIPEYYRESTHRLAVALLIYGMIIGLLSGGLLVIAGRIMLYGTQGW